MKVQLQALQARHPAATVGSRPALDDISFSLERGEQVAVIGPSGAGKTTLLQVMSCGLPPSAGTLQIDGVDPWGLTTAALQKLRGRLFLAPQVPPLPPRQRVVTAVLAGRLPAMGLWQSLRSLLYPVDLEAAHAALSHLDLADKMFERVDRLSGGERQRVALARALLAPATLWMVDEPLSALDPARARLVMRTLTEQARSQGITLVATLHQVESALLFFPRIIGMREGRVAFDLPSAAVTPERLSALYEHFEHELHRTPEAAPAAPLAEPVAVLHCR
ncbi:MAG: hypothetical protein RL657_1029 [Pseudomonadota bacterium]